MEDANVQSMLNVLLREVARTSGDRKVGRHKMIAMPGDDVTEKLDYLRLCIKYQVFDLEATRRENEHLRRQLQDHQPGDEDEEDGT